MRMRKIVKTWGVPILLGVVCLLVVLYMNTNSHHTTRYSHNLGQIKKSPLVVLETRPELAVQLTSTETSPTQPRRHETVSPELINRLHKLHSKIFSPSKDGRQSQKLTKTYNETNSNDTFCGTRNELCKDRVLILTPIRDASKHLDRYVKLIKSLNYPHHLVSLAFGEDSSSDQTKSKALALTKNDLKDFYSASLYVGDVTDNRTWTKKHRIEYQLGRRSHMAQSRNNLLFRSLRDERWVLWVDVDVGWFPPNIIQGLLYARKNIVVPSCLYRKQDGSTDVYDRNTWRETDESIKKQQKLASDKLVLEGYGESDRLFLPELKSEGEVVTIDGVGGCILLIRADLHRKGLIFPSFIFDHHIETEGLAKMAKAMHERIYGMPWVEVFHS